MKTYNDWLGVVLGASDSDAENVKLFRDYYDGHHRSKLSKRLLDVFGISQSSEFAVNFMRLVVDSFVERLDVTGFEVTRNGENQDDINALVKQWSDKCKFNLLQQRIYRNAGRDMYGFIMVDIKDNQPRLNLNFAYDGTDGVYAHYDSSGNMTLATKRWTVPAIDSITGKSQERLNIYHPDRVEYWIQRDGGWRPLGVDEKKKGELRETKTVKFRDWEYLATVTELVNAQGEPLGIPVIPFNNLDDGMNHGQSDIQDLLVIQEAINKTFIDMQEAADYNAFPLFMAKQPILDENNRRVAPSPNSVLVGDGVERVPPGDMSQLINTLETQIGVLARLSKLPLSQFTVTRQVQAEGTLKQQEAPLIAVCEAKQAVFGNAWSDAWIMALKMYSKFVKPVSDIDTLSIKPIWADVSPRSDSDTLDIALKKQQAGVPIEETLAEIGYDPTEIKKWGVEADTAANKQIAQIIGSLGRSDNESQASSENIIPIAAA